MPCQYDDGPSASLSLGEELDRATRVACELEKHVPHEVILSEETSQWIRQLRLADRRREEAEQRKLEAQREAEASRALARNALLKLSPEERKALGLPVAEVSPATEIDPIDTIREIHESRVPKVDWYEESESTPDAEPKIELAAPAKIVPYRDLPPGTVIRTPIKDHPGSRFDLHESAADAGVMVDEALSQVRFQSIIREASSHEVYRPNVDLSSLPAEEQPLYEGYEPGRFSIRSGSDVTRYERQFGDPTLMRLLAEEDNEELGPMDEDVPKLVRTASGVATVRLQKPVPTERPRAHPDDLGFEAL